MSECRKPPAGWRCTRGHGHSGPCAAIPIRVDSVGIERNVQYQRFEDMSPDGRLQLFVQPDGDVIVSIFARPRGPVSAEHEWLQLEFCSCGNGGGQSPRTREALHALAKAIQLDNEENPQSR